MLARQIKQKVVGQLICKHSRSLSSDAVTIVEVGPRDGLQNISGIIPTKIKIELINRLSRSGLPVIESASFVSPRAIPQLSDATDVMKGIKKAKGVRYPCLVPNFKGMETAVDCNVKEVAIFASASESFSQLNIKCSIEESLAKFEHVFKIAKQNDVKVRGYVSCVLGCPYEGPISSTVVAQLSERLMKMGCFEVSLGDTIGVGTPGSMCTLLNEVTLAIPSTNIAVHCHDTYGMALANILIALDHDVRVFDSSVGGLGGCPYAAGAAGNVATEDLLYLLNGCGVETNVDIDVIVKIARWICMDHLASEPTSKVAKAWIGSSLEKFRAADEFEHH